MRKVDGQVLPPVVISHAVGIGDSVTLRVARNAIVRLRKNIANEEFCLLLQLVIDAECVVAPGGRIYRIFLPVAHLVERIVGRTVRSGQIGESLHCNRIEPIGGDDVVRKWCCV